MVIACEECQTRFHVEDARIPQEGIRVRCSRCKHAFFVRHPAAGAEAEAEASPEPNRESDWHAAAEDAVSGMLAPPVTEDLASPPERVAEPLGSGEEDEWQFAIDPPDEVRERRAATATPETEPERDLDAFGEMDAFGELTPEETPESPPAAPDASSLADLDSPESWNLVPGQSQEPEPAPVTKSAPVAALEEPPAQAPPEKAAPKAKTRKRTKQAKPQRSSARPFGAISDAFGVLLVLGLLGWGMSAALSPSFQSPAVAPAAAVSLAGFRAEQLEGRFVENARGGPLYVVNFAVRGGSGVATSPGHQVRVVPVRSDGARLEGARMAGFAFPRRHTREEDPARLVEALESSARDFAWSPLGADQEVRLQAIFPNLPHAAAGFVLEAVPVRR